MNHKGVNTVTTIMFNTCAVNRPSRADVWRGARAAFNLSGSTACEYHFAGPNEDADREAMLNDWFAVNEDLDVALCEGRR